MRLPRALLLALLLPLAAVAPAAARTFSGVVSHVGDGDTVWVRPASGGAPQAVRLEGIDAPEICQPHGGQARDALAARVLRQRVRVTTHGQDNYRRLLGRIALDGDDVGGWMVERGHAWSYRFRGNAGPYAAEQAQARRGRRGLWGAPALEPRLFRKQHGSCRPGRD